VHDLYGVDVIPGGTGVEKLAAMTPEGLSRLIETLSCLEGYDILFFDTSAGISRDVISFCMASKEVVLVLMPEPTSLTDGYSLLKVLSLNGYSYPVSIVINQAKNEPFAQLVFSKFNETVKKYLPLEISYVGCLPADEAVPEAVVQQHPFVTLYPAAPATKGIARLARNLIDHSGTDFPDGAFRAFWEEYTDFAKRPLKLPQKKTKKKPDAPVASSLAEEKKEAADDPLSHQILHSLNRLVTVTTDIFMEVKKLRRALAKQADGDSEPAASKDGPPTPQLPPIISLDFESYVEKKRRLNR